MKKWISYSCTALAVCLAIAGTLHAADSAISINLNGVSTADTTGEGNLLATDIAGAAAVGNWNNVGTIGTAVTGLVDSAGASVSTSFTGSGYWFWAAGNINSPNNKLFRDYADTGAAGSTNGTTLSVADIPTSYTLGYGYKVYVYMAGDSSHDSAIGVTGTGSNKTNAAYSTKKYLLENNDDLRVGNSLVESTATMASAATSANYVTLSGFQSTSVALTFDNGTAGRARPAGLQIVASTPNRSFGINFSGGHDGAGLPSNENLHPLASSAIAGVYRQANWNNASVNAGDKSNILSPMAAALVDNTGAALSTSISWNANNCYSTTASVETNVDKELMNGYLDLNAYAIPQTPTTVTVSNVDYKHYDVYAYVGSDGDGRTGHGWLTDLSGTTIADSVYFITADGSFDGTTYVKATGANAASANASHYMLFHDVTASSFIFNLYGDGSNVGIHALQIVEIPEPTSLMLLAAGAISVLAYVLRKRK